MNNRVIYLCFWATALTLTSLPLCAQVQTTRSVTLKPIYKNGGQYFYDAKKVHSAWSLEIPLQACNNADVTKHFQRFKRMQRFRGLAYVPMLVWFLSSYNSGTYYVSNEIFYLYLGGLGTDLTLHLTSHYQMRKAIDLYNVAIMNKSTAGLRLETNPMNQTMVSIGYRVKF
jgi:hypothetical protein